MRLTNLAPWKWREANSLSRPGTDPFASLQQEINQLFTGLFEDGLYAPQLHGSTALVPKLDVTETEQELHVTVELPGMQEEDIDVEFTGDLLRIRGEKRDERNVQQHNFHRVERSFGLFERTIPVSVDVDRQKIQATFRHGVLNITLPKTVTAPASQKIAVKPGG